ncbi:MAG TPA: diadenylate cyclase [Desulfobacterales bacterium]
MDFLVNFFQALRWQDVLDILLNSYILFRFYVLFRGTNVLRVLFGLACIWFAQRLALSMGLIVSSWVSQGITAAAALIVVVIFRNEIRAVLQTKNIKAILWDLPQKEVTTPIEVISDSVFEMASRRIGALIVIPGKEELEEQVQHGVDWRGHISKEMIISIFWPDNPVHDGAAVISGNRVREVKCILPLSKREDLPSHYGTRHRAALGLAESTDALVVVVSEERGKVTVAKDGLLQPVYHPAELERRLRNHFGVFLKGRPGIINESLEIVLASVLSVFFTLGIWMSITQGLDSLASFDVPVEYMNRKTNQEIIKASDDSVELQISATRSLIRTVDPDQLRVRVDLSKAVIGRNSFVLTRENVTLPPGVILKNLEPERIDVTLDVLVEKELPLQADWVGSMPEGLLLASARLIPDRVVVIGPSRMLENLQTLYTEEIPVDPLTTSDSMTVTLALNPSVKLAPWLENRVNIDYQVQPREPL